MSHATAEAETSETEVSTSGAAEVATAARSPPSTMDGPAVAPPPATHEGKEEEQEEKQEGKEEEVVTPVLYAPEEVTAGGAVEEEEGKEEKEEEEGKVEGELADGHPTPSGRGLPPLAPPPSPPPHPRSTTSSRSSEAAVAGSPQGLGLGTTDELPARAQSSRGIVRAFPPAAAAGTPRAWSVQHYLRSNAQVNRLVQAALLKTLLHAIRRGSVEGVRVAIERGVLVQYLDSRQRNLIMFATKCDTDARLGIIVILADAGCDINHSDQLGWSCLHYACAAGAMDVASELVRRGTRIEYNPYGYGPEDFVIPKVHKAKSLLQHTEQLHHEKNVKACWEYFRRQAEKSGYSVKCRSHCDLGKPLRISFQAPAGHSPLDRIRVVDMNSDIALWLQASKTFPIPPGDIGSITLDVETLDRPSLYRIFYEKYEPTPVQLPPEVAETQLPIKNLDTGTTVSMGSVNSLVLKELASTRSGRSTKHLSNSSREASDSRTSSNASVRRMSTTRCRKGVESEHEASEESECGDEPESVPEDTITVATVEEHPTVHSITGVYRVVGMAIVSVSTLNTAKANEYEIVIKNEGRIGLHLEPKLDASKRMTNLIVRRSSGQAASVNPGDCLVAIGCANIEHAGLKHTLWELNEAARPMMLRFRRGTQNEKKSLFRKLTGGKSMPSIAV